MIIRIWHLIKDILHWGIYRVLRLELEEEKWEAFLEFVRFGIVGLSNTILSYLIYLTGLYGFRAMDILPRLDYLIAQLIGFLLSVLWSFYWNRKFVFHAEAIPWPKALLKTYMSYAFSGIVVSSVLSILWVQLIGISKELAPILNLLVSVPLNFLMNKFWAFRNGESRDIDGE